KPGDQALRPPASAYSAKEIVVVVAVQFTIQHSELRIAVLETGDDAGGVGRFDVLVVLLVDLNDRREAAGAKAFGLEDGEVAIGRYLADIGAGRLEERAEDIVGAAQVARDVGADL